MITCNRIFRMPAVDLILCDLSYTRLMFAIILRRLPFLEEVYFRRYICCTCDDSCKLCSLTWSCLHLASAHKHRTRSLFRVVQVCRLVKLWAKRRKVNSPFDGARHAYDACPCQWTSDELIIIAFGYPVAGHLQQILCILYNIHFFHTPLLV